MSESAPFRRGAGSTNAAATAAALGTDRGESDGPGGARSTRPVRSVLAVFVIAAVALVLMSLSLRARLGAHFGYLWFDEAFHVMASLEARSFADLQQRVAPSFQPILDYFLRWQVWVPLFGEDEAVQRVPGLVFSLSSIVLAGVLCRNYLLGRGHRPAYAWLGAAVAAMLLANHPLEIELSTEARHYALVTFLSVLWAGIALLRERPTTGRLALSSLLFVNTHFFALPIVGTVLCVLAIEQAVARKRRAAGTTLAVLAGIVLACIALNGPALRAMIVSPNSARQLHLTGASLLRAVEEARFIYERFLAQFDDGGVAVLAWGMLSLGWTLAGRDATQRASWLRLSALLAGALPIFLVLARLRTGYPFSPRYGMPYQGIGFALTVLGLDALPRVADAVANRARVLGERTRAALVRLPVALLAIQAALPAATLALRPGTLHLPSGGSAMRRTFENLKAMHRPIFLATSPCWAELVPSYYWKHAGAPPPPVPFEQMPSGPRSSCLAGGMDQSSQGKIGDFLARHREGVVLLYQYHETCHASPASVTRSHAAIAMHAERHPEVRGGNDLNSCLWMIAGASGEDEVRSIAAQVGFPPAINLRR